MAEIRVRIIIELREDPEQGEPDLVRRYIFVRPEKIKQLTDDEGFVGEALRSTEQEWLIHGG